MRAVMWVLGLVATIMLGVFVGVPGEQRDALFAELDTRVSKDGAGGIIDSIADGTVPNLIVARVAEVRKTAAQQIDVELAAIDQILSGELKIGAVESAPTAPPVKPVPAGAKTTTGPEQAEPERIRRQAVAPVSSEPAARTDTGATAQATDVSPAPGTPDAPSQIRVPETEDIFSGIISRDDRENQAAETSFWTDAKIKEALENGEPSSGGKRGCLFGCK